MKTFLIILIAFVSFSSNAICQKSGLIIDHNCCKIQNIPEQYINTAKQHFIIAYGHTSHGSQIVTGMQILRDLPNSYYSFNQGTGSLHLADYTPSGDLGNPDRTEWAEETRELLNKPNNLFNVVMWSWCGQADTEPENIDLYLNLMNDLEQEFPNVIFVYMTGHLNGTGEEGNLNQRNNQIRNFCITNGKVLFDFADIESYDPDGNNFLIKYADDGCYYEGGNWAEEWCEKNPSQCIDCDENYGGCAHSHCLNCIQKGKAFWWMMAKLAGWGANYVEQNEEDTLDYSKVILFQNRPNPASDYTDVVFHLPADDISKIGTALIEIFDIKGNLVLSLSEHAPKQGLNEITINTNKLAIGSYEIRLSAMGVVETKMMSIVR